MAVSRPMTDVYLREMLWVGFPAIVGGAFACQHFYGTSATVGFVLGALLSVTNSIGGFFLVRWGLDRSPTALLTVVLGGFLGRLALTLLTLLSLMLFTPVEPYALGLTVAVFYFLFLAVELRAMRHRLFPVPGATTTASSSS